MVPLWQIPMYVCFPQDTFSVNQEINVLSHQRFNLFDQEEQLSHRSSYFNTKPNPYNYSFSFQEYPRENIWNGLSSHNNVPLSEKGIVQEEINIEIKNDQSKDPSQINDGTQQKNKQQFLQKFPRIQNISNKTTNFRSLENNEKSQFQVFSSVQSRDMNLQKIERNLSADLIHIPKPLLSFPNHPKIQSIEKSSQCFISLNKNYLENYECQLNLGGKPFSNQDINQQMLDQSSKITLKRFKYQQITKITDFKNKNIERQGNELIQFDSNSLSDFIRKKLLLIHDLDSATAILKNSSHYNKSSEQLLSLCIYVTQMSSFHQSVTKHQSSFGSEPHDQNNPTFINTFKFSPSDTKLFSLYDFSVGREIKKKRKDSIEENEEITELDSVKELINISKVNSRFHNLNKLFMYNIISMLKMENLTNFGVNKQWKNEILKLVSRFKLSGKMRSKSEPLTTESFSHVHYNVLFLKITEKSLSHLQQSQRDLFLHNYCYNTDLKNMLEIEIVRINFLKNLIFQIFIQSIQEHKYTQLCSRENNSRVLYAFKAIRGIKKLSQGIVFNRF